MEIKINDETIMKISQADIKCLEDSLLDIKQWIASALIGKIHNCKHRMFNAWYQKIRKQGIAIPPTDDAFVDLITAQKDYKNRVAREAEEEEKRVNKGNVKKS